MVLANFQALQSARRRHLQQSQVDDDAAALDNAASGYSSSAGPPRRHDAGSFVQASVEQAARATDGTQNGSSDSGGRPRKRALQRLAMVGGWPGLTALLEATRDQRQGPSETGPYALAPHVPKPLQWLVRGDKESTETEPVQDVLYPPQQQAMPNVRGIAALPPRLLPLAPQQLQQQQDADIDDAFLSDESLDRIDDLIAHCFAEVSCWSCAHRQTMCVWYQPRRYRPPQNAT